MEASDKTGQNEIEEDEVEQPTFGEGDGISFEWMDIIGKGVVYIMGDSLHGEQIPDGYLRIWVDQINHSVQHPTMKHEIEENGFTALPKQCLKRH